MRKIKGNLIALAKQGNFDIIVHGCNCFNTMGSGIAKQIRENFSYAYEVDQKTVKGDRNKLGSFTVARIDHWSMVPALFQEADPFFVPEVKIFYVVNAYAQYEYGTNKQHFDYNAFQTFLYSFKNYVKLMSDSMVRKHERGLFNYNEHMARQIRIGLPMIGSGLAGGDWTRIEEMLKEFEESLKGLAFLTIVEYDGSAT
jgi:O-acetyl-ADP-ribose deacetylase (regulator of RNase III)